MAIKSGTIFNKEKGCFEGFIIDDENKIATDALVFMLVGLKGHWKYPIGYVLCDKINSENLKCLLSIILTEAKKRDINIHSVTMDGTTANINAMKLFGCKFGNSSENIDGLFSFEGHDYKVYFILDGSHMLKLSRYALGDLGTFVDGENHEIIWSYIQNLQELQEQEGLTFAGTIKFIRAIDKLFDILNSRTPFGKGYKQPIRLANDKIRFLYFTSLPTYNNELDNTKYKEKIKTKIHNSI